MSYKHIAIAQLDIDSVIHVVKMLSCEEIVVICICTFGKYFGTVFLHIVSAETIRFWTHKSKGHST